MNVQHDRITQLAAKVLNHPEASVDSQSFDAYFKIDKNIRYRDEVQAITGITREMLDEVGLEFDVAWTRFMTWLSDSRLDKVTNEKRPLVLVAHHGKQYDFKMIDAELKRHNLVQSWINDADISCMVDSLELFRDKSMWSSTGLMEPKSKNLVNLTEFLLHRSLDNAHNAIYDVAALTELLQSKGIKDIWRNIANSKQFYYDN